MLVQWAEIDGGWRVGEVELPTLPVPGQHISFGAVTDEQGDSIEFSIIGAEWQVEGNLVEGHIDIVAVPTPQDDKPGNDSPE